MVAKRIKRAINRARHEEYMAEYRRTGLEAQKKDRDSRARKKYQEWEEPHNTKHSSKKPVEECPWCQDVVRAKKRRDSVLNEAVRNQAS